MIETTNNSGNKEITVTFESPETGELLEEGSIVDVRIEDAEFNLSNSGNENCRLMLKVLNPQGQVVRTIWDNITFTDKALWKVQAAILSLGLSSTNGERVKLTEALLKDKVGRVQVGVESYRDRNGEERQTNRIARWLPPTTGF